MNTMWTVAGALVLVGTANAQLSIESLSSLGGTGSIAWDINDNGQVCGESLTAGDQFIRATLWQSNGSVSDLGGANGAVNSVAYAINSLGATVGYSEFASGLRTATLWNNTPRGVFNPVVDLGAAMNAQGSSVAWDINDFGAVAGQASLGPGFAKGFLWDDAKGGRIAGWSSMYQGGANRGINNSGVLVGSAFFFGDPDDAFLSRPDDRGGYEDSDIQPEGYNLSMATDISNTDICVGFTSHGVDEGWQAAIFLGRGEVQLLGTLAELESSEANAVNDAGMIVGYAWDSRDFELNPSAWAWVNGTMYDLNDFIEGTGFVHLLQATGVNNHGDIVGFGLLEDGTTSGFVIRGFVPAPGSVLALVAGLGMAGRRRR
jgi:probable HAF family extracellular repeat protein